MPPNRTRNKILPFFFLTLLFALPAAAQLSDLGKLTRGLANILEKAAQNQVVTARIFIFLIVVIALYEVFEHLKIRRGTSVLLGLLFGALVTAFTPTSLALLIGNLWTWLFAIVLLGVPFWLIWTAYTHFPKLLIPLTIVVIIFTGSLYQGLQKVADSLTTSPAFLNAIEWILYIVAIVFATAIGLLVVLLTRWLGGSRGTTTITPPSSTPITIAATATTTAAAAVTTAAQQAATTSTQVTTSLNPLDQGIETFEIDLNEGQPIETTATQEATTGTITPQTRARIQQHKERLKKRLAWLDQIKQYLTAVLDPFFKILVRFRENLAALRTALSEQENALKEFLKHAHEQQASLPPKFAAQAEALTEKLAADAGKYYPPARGTLTTLSAQLETNYTRLKLTRNGFDILPEFDQQINTLKPQLQQLLQNYEEFEKQEKNVSLQDLSTRRQACVRTARTIARAFHLFRQNIKEFEVFAQNFPRYVAVVQTNTEALKKLLEETTKALQTLYQQATQAQTITTLAPSLTPLPPHFNDIVRLLTSLTTQKPQNLTTLYLGGQLQDFTKLISFLPALQKAEKDLAVFMKTANEDLKKQATPLLTITNTFAQVLARTQETIKNLESTKGGKGSIPLAQIAVMQVFLQEINAQIGELTRQSKAFTTTLAQLMTP